MNEFQYKNLCKISDNILNELSAVSIGVVAVPFLHIIRSHPSLNKNYEFLFHKRILNLRFIKKIILNKLYLLRQFYYALFSDEENWYSTESSYEAIDILIFSHYLKNYIPKSNEDFYYGNIIEELKTYNINARIVQLNTTYDNKNTVKSYLEKIKSKNIILSRSLCIKNEIHINNILKNGIKLLKNKRRTLKDDFSKLFLSEALSSANSSGAKLAVRLKIQITELIKILNPKILIVTYEGHSWERLIINAVTSSKHSIRSIAYQHGAIFKGQHAMLRDISGPYNPDYIFCSSQYGRNLLEKSFTRSKTILYGTHKAIYGESNNKNADNTILVTPEGLFEECKKLFLISYQSAILNQNIKYIWRIHPMLTFNDLKKRYKFMNNLPTNIVISNQDFKTDIKRSKYILHRGSTAVIEAVALGLIPIYLSDKQDPHVITPLHMHMDKIIKISNSSDLSFMLNPKWKYNNEYLMEQCKNYFSKQDIGKIINLFN